MAFIFSDLVVLPVLRINAAYYGWKMSLDILLLLLSGLVVVSIILHYGMAFMDILPQIGGGQAPKVLRTLAGTAILWLAAGLVFCG